MDILFLQLGGNAEQVHRTSRKPDEIMDIDGIALPDELHHPLKFLPVYIFG